MTHHSKTKWQLMQVEVEALESALACCNNSNGSLVDRFVGSLASSALRPVCTSPTPFVCFVSYRETMKEEDRRNNRHRNLTKKTLICSCGRQRFGYEGGKASLESLVPVCTAEATATRASWRHSRDAQKPKRGKRE